IGALHSPAASRGWPAILARWFAALVVIGLLLHFLPLAPLGAALARVPLTRFLAVLIGYLLAHALGIVKWRMVVNAAGAELDLATSAQCYAGGLFGTLFLPSIIGGDVVRLAVGLRRSPRPAAVLTGNIADRFLDVTAQGGRVLLGLILLPGSLPSQLQVPARGTLLVLGGVIVAVLALVILLHRPLLGGRSIHFRRRLARMRGALRSVSRRPHILILGWLLGTLIQSSFLVLTALLAISCGLVLPLRIWLFAWPLAKLAAVLPLTQGGIGVREVALVALLAPFGAAAPLVLAAGLVWEGVIIAGGLVAGAVAFFLRRTESRFVPN
ncbi:MAG TPA: lysylphosphatidylglycerol synthase transmembrane domain-containing protein, partial [Ktedonobacterales bacterium]|nr:lysylphosphatidylglycerol synthase transmembrane domain-containing protein [Ktedonobacterales bacterium]